MAKQKSNSNSGNGSSSASTSRRAVVVAGVRTPFVKAFGPLMKVDTIGLGVAAVGRSEERRVGKECQ